MSPDLHDLSVLSQIQAAMQVAPDAVVAVLPYAVPVLEERLQAQEVSVICFVHICCFVLLATSILQVYISYLAMI